MLAMSRTFSVVTMTGMLRNVARRIRITSSCWRSTGAAPSKPPPRMSLLQMGHSRKY